MSRLAEFSGTDAFNYDGLEQQDNHLVADGKPLSLGIFEFNLRFPGQYFDKETGLAYNYFRDYDPQTGRYVQSDPIGLAGGINPYAYVDQSPLSRSDPLGLFPGEIPEDPVGSSFGEVDHLKREDCFFSCVEKHYGIADAAARGVVAAGAIPVDKTGRAPILGGASRFSNPISFYGPRIYGSNPKIGTQILGTNRWFGLLGRLNLVLGVGLASYDLTSILMCMDECLKGEVCYPKR
jgi:RHS repeat-associated protein